MSTRFCVYPTAASGNHPFLRYNLGKPLLVHWLHQRATFEAEASFLYVSNPESEVTGLKPREAVLRVGAGFNVEFRGWLQAQHPAGLN